MPAPSIGVVPRVSRLTGTVRVPGDKSISHRYAMFAAIADGVSRLAGYAPGADCAATLACLERLGVRIDRGTATEHTERRATERRATDHTDHTEHRATGHAEHTERRATGHAEHTERRATDDTDHTEPRIVIEG